MGGNDKIKWHKAYGFLANLLFKIYKKHGAKCGPALYEILKEQKVFTNDDKWFIEITVDKLRDNHGEVTSRINKNNNKIEGDELTIRPEITPLQIFASFNDISSSEKYRNKRYKILYKFLRSVIMDFNNPDNGEFKSDLDNSIKLDDFQLDYEGWVGGSVDNLLFFQPEKYQNDIWEILSHVFENTNTDLRKYYEVHVFFWHKIDISSFTLFLYWINANRYFPLNKDIARVLSQLDGGKDIFNSFSGYIKNCNSYKTITDKYINLVLFSQGKIEEEKVDFLKKFKDLKTKESLGKNLSNNLNIDIIKDFKILGLKVRKGDIDIVGKGKYYKSLKPDILYKFYDCYEFDNNEKTIEYKEENDFDFYTEDFTTKISISAVVGKNGAGKSSLFDIMMMIIYSLSIQSKILKKQVNIITGDTIPNEIIKRIKKIRKTLKSSKTDSELDKILKYLESFNMTNSKVDYLKFLNAELYIKADGVFKIKVDSGIVSIFKYKKDKTNKYIDIKDEYPCDENILSSLFYSIAINYSIYSLNRKDIGDWIFPLFHKNDSYQTPIVIEPYRRDGNIDINSQSHLVKTRMLSNILQPELVDKSKRRFNNSFRRIAEEQGGDRLKNIEFKDVERIRLTRNIDKLSRSIQINNNDVAKEDLDNYFDILSEIFGFKGIAVEKDVKGYILHKFITIASRYPQYIDYIRVDAKGILNPRKYSKELFKDKSHVTNKIRQAINYCKYDQENLYTEGEFNVDDIVIKIENIKKKDTSLSTIDLIPPSFFDLDIILNNEDSKDIPFNTLSSGEKQLNYAVNSILYHLNNIDSVSNELIKYRYVNIMLDEVELYFHPEMQRRYIYYLLEGIKRTKFKHIDGINICIITHSPYMLSDIPETNILFLGEKGEIENNKSKTFGANIHDLLINGFFMNNSMGDFVLTKVKEIIEFYRKVKEKSVDVDELDIESKKRKIKVFRLVVDNIGEDYLRGVLNEHLLFIENELMGHDYKILKLQKEIKRLKDDKNKVSKGFK